MRGSFFLTLFLAGGLSAQASVPVFGNSPDGDGTSFSLSVYNELSMSGGAVEFTPQENINVSSVTLWLADYTGYYGERVDASIWENYDNTPYMQLLDFNPASPNNGSMAAFTFCDPAADLFTDPSGSTTLSANASYWLVVTEGGPPGNYATGANWVGGGVPMGDSIYNGSDNYTPDQGEFDACSVLPAFTINTVPEPSFAGLTCLPLFIGAGAGYYRHQKKSA
jgi:hypothetical protein